ncbi:MAG TPA: phosphoribosylanthranilate isomerase [Methylomirabilota bacterium]
MVKIKICGITSVEDAMMCAEAGADALGFIFVEGTPRFIPPARAASIIRALPPFVTPVGVFWDHPAGHVKAVADACGLRALQFHGDETPDEVAGHALPVIKTIKLAATTIPEGLPEYRAADWVQIMPYVPHVSAILLDSAARWSEGEARHPIHWSVARHLARGRWRIILSAGLTPDNVAAAITTVGPYGVDVNSGVEAAPGRKDAEKVRRFVAEARRAVFR